MADPIKVSTLEEWYSLVYGFYNSIGQASGIPSSSGKKAGDKLDAASINTLITNLNNLNFKSYTESNKKNYFAYSKWSTPPKKVTAGNLISDKTRTDINTTIDELKNICINNSITDALTGNSNSVNSTFANSGYGQTYDSKSGHGQGTNSRSGHGQSTGYGQQTGNSVTGNGIHSRFGNCNQNADACGVCMHCADCGNMRNTVVGFETVCKVGSRDYPPCGKNCDVYTHKSGACTQAVFSHSYKRDTCNENAICSDMVNSTTSNATNSISPTNSTNSNTPVNSTCSHSGDARAYYTTQTRLGNLINYAVGRSNPVIKTNSKDNIDRYIYIDPVK